MSELQNFCPSCGTDMSEKQPHKETCLAYLKQWAFVFSKGNKDEHTLIFYGNTKEQALSDMLKFYKDAVNEAEELGMEDSTLLDGCDEIKETGVIEKFG